MKVTVQLGQVKFHQCEFDGVNENTGGINVELNSIATSNDQIYAVKFDTCTYKASDLGAKCHNVLDAEFTNCYFENFHMGINGDTTSNLVIKKPRFANVSNGGSGYCIYSSNVSFIDATGTVTSYQAKVVLINTSATQFKTISAKMAVGESITYIAWGGGTVVLNRTGNISFVNGTL